MRTLYTASLVFLLNDMYTKEPIEGAIILCDGKQIRYGRKKGGYYVFSNLYPKRYRIDIVCRGFIDLKLDINARSNETKVVLLNLPYSSDNKSLQNMKRFEMYINVDGNAWKNKNVRLKLKNELGFLKLIEKAEKKKSEISLNIGRNTSLTLQRYIYATKETENEIYIFSHDIIKNKYMLKEPLKADLEPEGFLHPIWNLKTDKNGKVILPVFRQFMKEEKAKIEIFTNEKYGMIELDVPEEDSKEKSITVNVNLTEAVPEPLPISKEKEDENISKDDGVDLFSEEQISLDSSIFDSLSISSDNMQQMGSPPPVPILEGNEVPPPPPAPSSEGNEVPPPPPVPSPEGNEVPPPPVLSPEGNEVPPPPAPSSEGTEVPPPPVLSPEGNEVPPPPAPNPEGNELPPPPAPSSEGNEVPPPPVPSPEGNEVPPPPAPSSEGNEVPPPPPVPSPEGNEVPPPPAPSPEGNEVPPPPAPSPEGNEVPPPPAPSPEGNSTAPKEAKSSDEVHQPEKRESTGMVGMPANAIAKMPWIGKLDHSYENDMEGDDMEEDYMEGDDMEGEVFTKSKYKSRRRKSTELAEAEELEDSIHEFKNE